MIQQPKIRHLTFVVLLSTVFAASCAKQPASAIPQPPAVAASETADTRKIVVAKVNDKALNMNQLVEMMNRLPPRGGEESLDERKARALDSIILREIAYQRAKEKAIQIEPQKIDLAIDNFKINMGGEQEYQDFLAGQHMTEADIRGDIERALMIERIYTQEVVNAVSVPEAEIKSQYEKEKDKLVKPEKLVVTDVAVVNKGDKPDRERAEQVLQKIKAAPERDPWKLVLDGTFTVRKRVLRKEDRELYEAGRTLQQRDISGVIDTPSGFHIMKLETYSPEQQMSFDEAKQSLETKLKQPSVDKRTKEWEQELRKSARIEVIDTGTSR